MTYRSLFLSVNKPQPTAVETATIAVSLTNIPSRFKMNWSKFNNEILKWILRRNNKINKSLGIKPKYFFHKLDIHIDWIQSFRSKNNLFNISWRKYYPLLTLHFDFVVKFRMLSIIHFVSIGIKEKKKC